jgi:hemolysin III
MYPGERFNSITHLIGTALAITGSALLITFAALDGDPWKIVSFSIFGCMLVVLYAASTLYHAIRGERAKAVLRRFDHCAIYLLIAGTYTPFTLVTLRGALGWTLFAAIWAMAIVGIVRAWRNRAGTDPAAWPYLVMGWLGVCAVVPLVSELGGAGMLWLAAGGALYSAGVLFYANDRRWRHAHGIWHLFVMGGSAAHFVTVFYFVR